MFARVVHSVVEHPSAALRTFAERLLAGKINRLGGTAFAVLRLIAEIELKFVFGTESDDRGEGPALPAAETLQRAELFLADQPLDFLRLHEPARQKRGQAEVALLTLKPAVILFNHAAALGARSFEIAEIARHFIARIRLGALDYVPGHVGDLFHELRTREPPVLHLLEL